MKAETSQRRHILGTLWSRVLVAAMICLGASVAHAAQSAGGVIWLDPLAYQKPAFVPITLPTIVTNYYIDMTSGTDSSSCGTGTGNPCKTLRGVVDRDLSGLRGNVSDGAAAINIRGTGSGAFYIFNNTLAGTPGKEILIRPWGNSAVTFRRGGQNQGLNDGVAVHDIIIDGGDPSTGNMLFKFVSDNGGCGGPCSVLAIAGNNITVARTQFTATATTGQPYLSLVCNVDNLYCHDIAFVNNEFYDCNTNTQCSAVYPGACTASGSCHVDNFTFRNNIVRNMGGEGIEINPRTNSTNYVISGNAIHNVGYGTCSTGFECRPGITLNINQSGAVNLIQIYNNLMWDIASGCVWEKSDSKTTNAPKIFNNTCYDYGKGTGANGQPQGFSAVGATSAAIVTNNIIFAPNGTNPFSASVGFIATNNVCGSGKSCGSASRLWSTATVVSTDPNNSGYLKIASGSEAVATGTVVLGVTVDYSSILRVTSDIGAFALSSGTSSAFPTPANLRITN